MMASFFVKHGFILFIFKYYTMKRLLSFLHSNAKPAAGLLLASVLFVACKKDNDTINPRVPQAGLMAFNLSPDQNAVVMSLGGTNLGNSSLAYNSYTGTYLPVTPGTREVRSFDFNSGNTLATSSANFADSGYYSAFLLGTTGNYRNVIVKDELETLTATAGKAWVRYINAIPDTLNAPTVTIAAGGTNVFNETGTYGNVSSYAMVNAGEVTTSVTNGEGIDATRNITLEENKVYTVLLTGLSATTDSTRDAEVKFIVNGTVTP